MVSVRVNTTNRGGIQQDITSGGWSVLYTDPATGEIVLGHIPYDSEKSVKTILSERGVDIEDAIVEFHR